MDDPSNCRDTDDTADVYSAGSDLIRQFSKVLEKMKLRQLPSSRDVEQLADEGRERPKLMEAAGGCGCQVGCGNSSNADLERGALCRQSAVRMEPSELRLVIRLDPWVSEGGQLIVRPSLVTEAAGGSDAGKCGDCGRGPGAAVADTQAPRTAGGARVAADDKAKPAQLLGSIQGRQQPPPRQGTGPASGDAGQRLRQQLRQQQQQLQQLRQKQQQTNNHQDNFQSSGGESDESADDQSSSGDILPTSPIGGGRRQQPATVGLKSPQRVRGGGRFCGNK